MTAAELKNHVAISTVAGKFVTTCSLGCEGVRVGRRKSNVYFQTRKNTHPQSTKCYWSGRSLQDQWLVHPHHPEELPLAREEEFHDAH